MRAIPSTNVTAGVLGDFVGSTTQVTFIWVVIAAKKDAALEFFWLMSAPAAQPLRLSDLQNSKKRLEMCMREARVSGPWVRAVLWALPFVILSSPISDALYSAIASLSTKYRRTSSAILFSRTIYANRTQ